jgi:formylglycine-generating enzyme required for sulfatase activity
MRLAILAAILCLPILDVRAVTINWSPVGNPGNANDTATGSIYGAVAYLYDIGTYDVTDNQYVAFLNAKDPTGANSLGLYSTNMSDPTYGGINYNAGNANGSKYSTVPGLGNHPVNAVSWFGAIRFANWLNNGQGTGDTETGAYTLLGGTPIPSNANSITRNPGATIFLPSETEWYKAAYYNPATASYFLYPTSSNSEPGPNTPNSFPGEANYNFAVGNLTDVGAYTGTTSPYGAFDMGGNVFQWLESFMNSDGLARGGSFFTDSSFLRSTGPRVFNGEGGDFDLGFRLASIPGSALFADVNHDHVVNGLDISLVASNWLRAGIGIDGDGNGDGVVNGLDIALIASHWLQTAGAGNGASVPEPSTIVLATVGGVLALRRWSKA